MFVLRRLRRLTKFQKLIYLRYLELSINNNVRMIEHNSYLPRHTFDTVNLYLHICILHMLGFLRLVVILLRK
jgi:hypothetical protein